MFLARAIKSVLGKAIINDCRSVKATDTFVKIIIN